MKRNENIKVVTILTKTPRFPKKNNSVFYKENGGKYRRLLRFKELSKPSKNRMPKASTNKQINTRLKYYLIYHNTNKTTNNTI